MAWLIAPCLSGAFASVIFLITKFGVMLRKNPVWKAFFYVPVYFGLAASLLTMLLLWKGGSYKIELSDGALAGVIVAVGFGWGLLMLVTLMPWLYRVVICDDWELRWYHIPMGLLLLRRGTPPPPPHQESTSQEVFAGATKEDIAGQKAAERGDVEAAAADGEVKPTTADSDNNSSYRQSPLASFRKPHKSLVGPKPEGKWYQGAVLFWYLKWAVLRGVDQDVVNLEGQKSVLAGGVEEIHSHAARYDTRAEYMYSFLQVMTAATASFTHGANDIANAIGPYATVYEIWNSGVLPKTGKAEVPIWILVFGGGMLILGVWTYGYNIMRNLGNRLTLQSPSRGFSMELGSAITVILATRLKLPVSTTQCITGATVGVGLCSGTWRTVNWRMVGWIYAGWIITLPMTGILSGCLMGIIINAPRWS